MQAFNSITRKLLVTGLNFTVLVKQGLKWQFILVGKTLNYNLYFNEWTNGRQGDRHFKVISVIHAASMHISIYYKIFVPIRIRDKWLNLRSS